MQTVKSFFIEARVSSDYIKNLTPDDAKFLAMWLMSPTGVTYRYGRFENTPPIPTYELLISGHHEWEPITQIDIERLVDILKQFNHVGYYNINYIEE